MSPAVPKAQRDVAFDFASFIRKTRYEDVLGPAGEATRKSILDTLGVTVAGTSLGQGGREVMEIATEAGGKPESTIIGFGVKVPCAMAAFANGAISHCLDYDDILDAGYVHPSVTTVPAALAIAEKVGGVSGREFLTTIAIGNDLICRLGLSYTRRPEGFKPTWMFSPLLGVFSAAAVCCRLLKLDEERTRHALGIALEQAGGSRVYAHGAGATLRGLYANFPARAGVFAALMAEKGITTGPDIFEGKSGFFNLYFGGSYDRNSLTEKLGKHFTGADISFKPWPSCRESHTFIEAALNIVRNNRIEADDITEIKVHVGEVARQMCLPLEGRRRPQTVMDAKFNIPFPVAVAAAYHEVKLKNFTEEGIRDGKVHKVAEKVVPEFDPELAAVRDMPAARVTMKTRDGKTYSETVQTAYGHPQKPLPQEELIGKFRDCLGYSVKPVSAAKLEKAIELLLNLEEVADISEVIRLLG